MRAAGIGGVIVDWYGTSGSFDYAQLQKATEAIFAAVKRAGLSFAVCYEDQSVSRRIEAREIMADGAAAAAAADMAWAASHWFSDDAYLKIQGRPVVLCFGPQYFTKAPQWSTIFSGLSPAP